MIVTFFVLKTKHSNILCLSHINLFKAMFQRQAYHSNASQMFAPKCYPADTMSTTKHDNSDALVQLALQLLRSPHCGQAAANYIAANPNGVDHGFLPDVYSADNLNGQRLLQDLDDAMIDTDDSEGTERDLEGKDPLYIPHPTHTSE